jgi:predicted branched-subunit amino acid permease
MHEGGAVVRRRQLVVLEPQNAATAMSDSPTPHDHPHPRRESLRAGMRAGVPFATAAFVLAISFGVIAEPVIGGVEAVVMSVTVFAGSSQFAAVAVLGGGGGALAASVAGLLLNLRYVPMGIAIAPWVGGSRRKRALTGQTMIDFSWAAASRGEGRFDPTFMIGATIPAYPVWVIGTVIGVVAGGAIGNPEAFGLDALFPAFFLALLVEGELRSRDGRIAAAIGAVIAFALIPVAPAGLPVIAATAAALIGLRRRNRSQAADAATAAAGGER